MDFYEKNFKAFSDTRHCLWRSVEEFSRSFNESSIVLDAGCGNGKNMKHLEGNVGEIIGFDSCKNFVRLCKEKCLNVIEGDIRTIPYCDEKFDFIFCWMKISNLDPEILDNLTTQCYEHLNPGGVIIWGVYMREVALNYFIVRRTHEYGMVESQLIESSENCKWLTLIDNDVVHIDVDRVPTSGEDACLESTHYSIFWENDALTNRLSNLLPDAEVVTRRLPPMWSIQNPMVIKKSA